VYQKTLCPSAIKAPHGCVDDAIDNLRTTVPQSPRAGASNTATTSIGRRCAIAPGSRTRAHFNLFDLWREGSFVAPEWQRIVRPRHFYRTETLFLPIWHG
jgi:hypothetical protein